MLKIYDYPNYKVFLLLPLLLAIGSLLVIPSLTLGTDLKGGTSISVALPPGEQFDAKALEERLSHEDISGLSVRSVTNPLDNSVGVIVEYSGSRGLLALENADDQTKLDELSDYAEQGQNTTAADLFQLAKNDFDKQVKSVILGELGVDENSISIREIGPTLGAMFWEQSIRALVLAFALMAIVVFIAFRALAPSTYVVASVFLDVLCAVGAMAFFQIPLSLPTFAALLMLIGYSVDTDVMLTNKVLKGKRGTVSDRMHSALSTGLTMTATTLTALIVLITVSYFTHITMLFQISAVLFFGLVSDVIATWMMNAVVLKWWTEGKQ